MSTALCIIQHFPTLSHFHPVFFDFSSIFVFARLWPDKVHNGSGAFFDLFIHWALLVILILGTFFLELQTAYATEASMILCTVVTLLILLGLMAIAVESTGRYFWSRIFKPYRFFLPTWPKTHQIFRIFLNHFSHIDFIIFVLFLFCLFGLPEQGVTTKVVRAAWLDGLSWNWADVLR